MEVYCDEIRPYWILVTKGYGFTVNDIDYSCPNDLEPYAKARELELKENDSIIHAVCGTYVMSAVFTAVEHCLGGKKSRSKYTDKLLMQETTKNGKLSEEELQRKRELFVAKLQVMKTNFELSHMGDTK